MAEWGLLGLFVSAFLSSTLLPGGSEVLLAALSLYSEHSAWILVAVASVGNTLGGMTSWLLGWFLARRYPVPEHLPHEAGEAVMRLRRWGSPVLLLSWIPIVGDPLCVAAGWLRISVTVALFWIGLGKVLRYVAVSSLTVVV